MRFWAVGKELMSVFISSTTETMERRGKGTYGGVGCVGDGVGIGTLKTRIDDQKVAYANGRGMKMSMVNVALG